MDLLADLIGDSAPILAVRQRVHRLLERQRDARRLPPILLQGETGTGKGLVARALHRASQRRAGPFVDVNCAAIPETLLESEMFGFERGAFTDARQAKAGLFQTATGGSIFLDEVALLPDPLQAKLLKVIEERTVRRLGSTHSEPIDVWIITGTNEDLAAAAAARRFREDLYHRLAVVTIQLPPLRDRGHDVVVLAEHFLARACADYGLPPKELDDSARRALLAYRWPGNVRELGNVMERVALLAEASHVDADMLGLPELPRPPRTTTPDEPAVALDETVETLERQHLLQALEGTSWNISRAAVRLGLSRNAVRWRIDKYGLRRAATPGRETRPRKRSVTSVARDTNQMPAVVSHAPEIVPVATSVRWERRRVTLLRADLVSVPSELESTDVGRHLPALLEKIQTFRGRVQDITPTRSVAVFGLDLVEDAPRRAANAALAMRRAAERSRDTGGDQPWAVKIALHVIEGAIGRIGGDVLLDQETKRTAWSRLEALIGRAEPDEVVVSETVAPFLERRFQFSRVEGAAARLSDAVPTGLGPAERMVRFVGREREFALLRSQYEMAASGRGQIIGIVGEAGIGKSRLLYEFCQELTRSAGTMFEGHCLSYGVSIPYLPVLEIVRAICGIAETDSPETITDRVRRVLSSHGIDAARSVPYLLHLLGLRHDSERLAQLGTDAVKAGIFESLRGIILNESRQRALVLLLEDLHWIDPISEEFLTSLLDVLAATRILVVATYRPGYRPPWVERSYFTQIALQALTSADSQSIVRTVLGRDLPSDVIELIVARAEGNPFFLEELARTVREEGDAALASVVPATVEEVLLARIRRLSALQQLLLQSAAVIGKDVSLTLLRAVVGLTDDALEAELAALTVAEFVHPKAGGSDADYSFKHILTQEVAYWTLLPGERQALHARIVDAIEGLHGDRLDEHVEHLAHHAFQGQSWSKAVAYLRRAGAKATGRSANREAVTYFEQALAALQHLLRTRDTIEQAIDVRFELRNPLHLLANVQRIFEHLGEAQTLAVEIDDQWRLAWVLSYLTQCWRLTGHPERAIETGQRALGIAEDRGDFKLQIATEMHLGPAYEDIGDYRRASTILRGIVERLQGNLQFERFGLSGFPSLGARAHLVCCLAELGEFAEASARGAEAIRIADDVFDPNGLVNAYFGVGSVLICKGDFQQAIPVLERGRELCESLSLSLMAPRVTAALAFTYGASGRLAEAIPLLEQALAQTTSMQLTNMSSMFLVWLGETYARAGRMTEAWQATKSALERGRTQRQRAQEAYALRLLADLMARQEPPNLVESDAHYRESLAIAEELGMRPLIGQCQLGLSRLSRRAGEPDRAEHHLAVARSLFREMDMRFWLEAAGN